MKWVDNPPYQKPKSFFKRYGDYFFFGSIAATILSVLLLIFWLDTPQNRELRSIDSCISKVDDSFEIDIFDSYILAGYGIKDDWEYKNIKTEYRVALKSRKQELLSHKDRVRNHQEKDGPITEIDDGNDCGLVDLTHKYQDKVMKRIESKRRYEELGKKLREIDRASIDSMNAEIDRGQNELLNEYRRKAVRSRRANGAGNVMVEAFEMPDESVVYCRTTITNGGKAVSCRE